MITDSTTDDIRLQSQVTDFFKYIAYWMNAHIPIEYEEWKEKQMKYKYSYQEVFDMAQGCTVNRVKGLPILVVVANNKDCSFNLCADEDDDVRILNPNTIDRCRGLSVGKVVYSEEFKNELRKELDAPGSWDFQEQKVEPTMKCGNGVHIVESSEVMSVYNIGDKEYIRIESKLPAIMCQCQEEKSKRVTWPKESVSFTAQILGEPWDLKDDVEATERSISAAAKLLNDGPKFFEAAFIDKNNEVMATEIYKHLTEIDDGDKKTIVFGRSTGKSIVTAKKMLDAVTDEKSDKQKEMDFFSKKTPVKF